MQDPSPLLRGFDAQALITPAEALARFFAVSGRIRVGTEVVALGDATGRVLAAEVVAREDHPGHPRSTMDGFAVASGGGKRPRRIAFAIAMGTVPATTLAIDEAARIATGGVVPTGADAVIPQEEVRVVGDTLEAPEPVAAGQNVTPRGSDIAAGTVVLEPGRRLGGAELGVLATLGYPEVSVYARPRVAVLSTGDELVDVADPVADGRIRDSNRYAIAGTLVACGAIPIHRPRVADSGPALESALRDALRDHDAVITTGGSSVGERDLLPAVVARIGGPGIVAHGLRVKPGKPTLLGVCAGKPVIGLPGNPASALLILEIVGRPIIAELACESPRRHAPAVTAEAAATFAGRSDWVFAIPTRLTVENDRLRAWPLEIRSAQTSLLARAAGYVLVGERTSRHAPGTSLSVTLFAAGGAPVWEEV